MPVAWKVMGESTWFYNQIIFLFNTRVFWVLLLSDTHKPGDQPPDANFYATSHAEQMLSPQLCQKPRGWDYIVAPVPPLSNWPNQMMKEVGSQISPRPKLDIEWLVIWVSKEIWLRHSNFLVSLFNELATLKDLPFRDYMCLNSRRQKVIALISFYFPPSELYAE